jgi:hypothetical protein
MERTMKLQDVILKALAKKISWTEAAVLRLYREVYSDLNIRHFHEKLRECHQIELSYTWVQQALQGAGLEPLPQSRFKPSA